MELLTEEQRSLINGFNERVKKSESSSRSFEPLGIASHSRPTDNRLLSGETSVFNLNTSSLGTVPDESKYSELRHERIDARLSTNNRSFNNDRLTSGKKSQREAYPLPNAYSCN